MKRGTRLVCILLLCLSSVISWGDTPGSQTGSQTKTESQQVLNTASYYNAMFSKTSIDSNDTRLQYAKLAYDAAVISHDYYEKANSLMNMGIAYNHQYRYNLAMESFLKAEAIADSINSNELSASVFHHMGELYLDMRNIKLAGQFFTYALEIRKKSKDFKDLAETLNGLALVSWLSSNHDTAIIYLNQTLEIARKLNFDEGISRAYNNLGIVYHEKKEYTTALTNLFQALKSSESHHDFWWTAEICNNIGESSISMGNYIQAEKYLAKARENALPIKAVVLLADNYRYMARMYSRTGKYELAFTYLEKFHFLDDSVFNRNNYTIISELTSAFELEKKEHSIVLQKQQIELYKQKKRNDNLLKAILLLIILSMLLIAWLIISRQKRINIRNKLLLEKDEQLIAAQGMLVQREKEEKKRLILELDNKNRFLIDFALYIGMKNEFLLTLREQLKKLLSKNGTSPEIKEMIFHVNQNLRYNREVVDLQQNVEKVNFEFIQKLMERFPNLNENEKHLVILLRLKFTSKEIADLRAVSVKAIEISRYRLKKKMNLDDNDSLTSFVQKI
jgi:tetratricopeptide (TPR) repeat protein